jgi:hypothetical protein
MTGYGLTVFHGSRVDTFGVQVLGVQRHARTAGNIILVELSGHDLEKTAIPRGMSGSPVFLDGRFAGAVAFGWSGALRPIVGLTPAEEMMALPAQRESLAGSRARDLSAPAAPTSPADQTSRPVDLAGTTESALYPASPALPMSLHLLLDPERRGRTLAARVFPEPALPAGAEHDLPLRFPFGPNFDTPWPAPAELAARIWQGMMGGEEPEEEQWQPLPTGLLYSPLDSPGLATAPVDHDPPHRLIPGSACAVPLVMGDALMGALGTTSWVDGDRVYLMGHPLMQQGAVDLPLAMAEILGIFPSRQLSFKLGTIGPVVGSVHHDLRAGLTGNLGEGPEVVPVRVNVLRMDQTETYSFAVVRDPRLTPALVFWCLYNALLVRGDDLSLQTIHYDIRTTWRRGTASGEEPVQLAGAVSGPGRASSLAPAWMAPLQILMANRHERLDLGGVEATLTVTRPMSVATIASVQMPSVARPGAEVAVTVNLEPRRGTARAVHRKLALPDHLPPGRYRLLVANAAEVFALETERAAARFADRSLAATLELIRAPRAATQLMLVLYAPSRGAVVDGRELGSLPSSAGYLLRSDVSGRVTHTVADIVVNDRLDCDQVLQGHVISDLLLQNPLAPTREETRP